MNYMLSIFIKMPENKKWRNARSGDTGRRRNVNGLHIGNLKL